MLNFDILSKFESFNFFILMLTHSFQNEKDTLFGETVRKRVWEYLSEKKINPFATNAMILKTTVLFFSYLAVYSILIWNPFESIVLLFVSYAILGLLLGAIGMNIMHDKVHGAYVKSPAWNALLEVPILCIGLESKIWHIEHNVLHHNYTNIESIDQDIHHRFIFRFSNNQSKRWFHRYQFIYAPFIYGLLLFEWLTAKDFIKVVQYRKRGLIDTDRKALLLFFQIFVKKIFFHGMFLIVPLIFVDFPAWIILLGYSGMLAVGGLFMTMVFQLAHIVPSVKFIASEDVNIKENWYIHQLQTTSNFAPKNSVLTHVIGGLNYQIEHHLFPTICHAHYPEIAPIVERTCLEFELPYYQLPSLGAAVSAHFSLLKNLGR